MRIFHKGVSNFKMSDRAVRTVVSHTPLFHEVDLSSMHVIRRWSYHRRSSLSSKSHVGVQRADASSIGAGLCAKYPAMCCPLTLASSSRRNKN